jgi:hypothetical protein
VSGQWAGEGEGRGGRAGLARGAAGGRVWRGAHGGGCGKGSTAARGARRGRGEAAVHGGEEHTARAGEGHTAHGEGRTRRVTETSERRGRRKEKARKPFISPLCRVPAIWHSAKIFF